MDYHFIYAAPYFKHPVIYLTIYAHNTNFTFLKHFIISPNTPPFQVPQISSIFYYLCCVYLCSQNSKPFLFKYISHFYILPPSKFLFKFTPFFATAFFNTTAILFLHFSFFVFSKLDFRAGLFSLPEPPENANLSPCGKLARLKEVSVFTRF